MEYKLAEAMTVIKIPKARFQRRFGCLGAKAHLLTGQSRAPVQPVQCSSQPPDPPFSQQRDEFGITITPFWCNLTLLPLNVRSKQSMLSGDQPCRPLSREAACQIQLERKIEAHITWVLDRLIDPALHHLSSFVSQSMDMARRPRSDLLAGSGNQPVAFELPEQRVEVTWAQVHDASYHRRHVELSRQLITMRGTRQQESKKSEPGGLSSPSFIRHGFALGGTI
jgi:hypothetical protein